MNKAPALPLTVDLIGELVKNKELGRRWQLRCSKGLVWTHLPRGIMPSKGFPGICCRWCGGNGVALPNAVVKYQQVEWVTL
jgi:hypothetical protein